MPVAVAILAVGLCLLTSTVAADFSAASSTSPMPAPQLSATAASSSTSSSAATTTAETTFGIPPSSSGIVSTASASCTTTSHAVTTSPSTTASTVDSSSTTAAADVCGGRYKYRPDIVREALENNRTIYYFGLGSNMSRKKLENRGINGTKINVISMEAAYVPDHRLSFNMRGFPPLEPGMGSIEPVNNDLLHRSYSTPSLAASASRPPFLAYHRPECHGALVLLTADDYEKVMRSEGVGGGSDEDTEGVNESQIGNDDCDHDISRRFVSRIQRHWRRRRRLQRHRKSQRKRQLKEGYEEVVVDAYPYSDPTKPVKAIALRARPHVRLPFDPYPSARYMSILKEGAKELGLKPCYQTFLEEYPVQQVPAWLKKESLYNLITTFTISSALKWRGFSRLQTSLLFAVYNKHDPSAGAAWRQVTSDVLTSLILFPGAVTGFFIYQTLRLMGRTPPFVSRFLTLLDPDFGQAATTDPGASTNSTETSSNGAATANAVAADKSDAVTIDTSTEAAMSSSTA